MPGVKGMTRRKGVNEFSPYMLRKALENLDRQIEKLKTSSPMLYAQIQRNRQVGIANPFSAAETDVERKQYFLNRVGSVANDRRKRNAFGVGRILHAFNSDDANCQGNAERVANLIAHMNRQGRHLVSIVRQANQLARDLQPYEKTVKPISIKAIKKMLADLEIGKGQGRK